MILVKQTGNFNQEISSKEEPQNPTCARPFRRLPSILVNEQPPWPERAPACCHRQVESFRAPDGWPRGPSLSESAFAPRSDNYPFDNESSALFLSRLVAAIVRFQIRFKLLHLLGPWQFVCYFSLSPWRQRCFNLPERLVRIQGFPGFRRRDDKIGVH